LAVSADLSFKPALEIAGEEGDNYRAKFRFYPRDGDLLRTGPRHQEEHHHNQEDEECNCWNLALHGDPPFEMSTTFASRRDAGPAVR